MSEQGNREPYGVPMGERSKAASPLRAAKPEAGSKKNEPATFAPRDLETPSRKFVKHLPMDFFSARVIRVGDWESIGVYDQGSVEWNLDNNFSLPIEMFNDKALNYLSNVDDGFEIVGS